MPHGTERTVINTILYVLITGCRWCYVPIGPTGASKSAAHRWLKRWETDGTLFEVQSRILGLATETDLIDWNFFAVDGSFSVGKGGGEGVAHGYKGKGILIHTLTDANGMPLSNRTYLLTLLLPMEMKKHKSSFGCHKTKNWKSRSP